MELICLPQPVNELIISFTEIVQVREHPQPTARKGHTLTRPWESTARSSLRCRLWWSINREGRKCIKAERPAFIHAFALSPTAVSPKGFLTSSSPCEAFADLRRENCYSHFSAEDSEAQGERTLVRSHSPVSCRARTRAPVPTISFTAVRPHPRGPERCYLSLREGQPIISKYPKQF